MTIKISEENNKTAVTQTHTITKICRGCQKPFTYSADEAAWLDERGLGQYKNCAVCRKEKKERAALNG